MKNFLTITSLLIAATFGGLISALTIPNADTPAFYLVSSSTTAAMNLLPLRMTNGGGSGFASLTGTGPPAIFYFYQGMLTIYNTNNGNMFPYRPLVNTQLTANGCADFGAVAFIQGGSTNKCARYTSFQIQSNNQNSQLGAELVFNYVGGFYACSSGQEVWYKVSASELGPADCVPIHLNTIAVP